MIDAASVPVYVAVWAVGAVRENFSYHLHTQTWDIETDISHYALKQEKKYRLVYYVS